MTSLEIPLLSNTQENSTIMKIDMMCFFRLAYSLLIILTLTLFYLWSDLAHSSSPKNFFFRFSFWTGLTFYLFFFSNICFSPLFYFAWIVFMIGQHNTSHPPGNTLSSLPVSFHISTENSRYSLPFVWWSLFLWCCSWWRWRKISRPRFRFVFKDGLPKRRKSESFVPLS